MIDSEIEMLQIVRKAPDNPEEKRIVKDKTFNGFMEFLKQKYEVKK